MNATAPDAPPSLEHVAQIDSTNAELLRRPFGAAPRPPLLLLADVQGAGRGRNGRRWLSDPGASLTMSLAYERRQDARSPLGLSLAVGVALADALRARGVALALKWPNDLYRVDAGPAGPAAGKAGGILVEMRQSGELQRIVVGFGLNLVATRSVTEGDTGQPVAALFEAGTAPERTALARELGAAVAGAVARFFATGLAPFAARWRELDYLRDREVDVRHGDGRHETGIAQGIDADGALRVKIGERLERLIGGEVSVRRRG